MKKVILGVLVALTATSCTTVRKTATTMDVDTNASSRSTADLVVSPERQMYDYRPPKSVRRGGLTNAKNTAVAELLRQTGGDVLVHPQFETAVRTGLFGQKKIKRVVVTGYPATYRNFQSKNDNDKK